MAFAFVAGALVGGYIVKRYAIYKAESAVSDTVDSILGKGSAYGGPLKTFANMFIESN